MDHKVEHVYGDHQPYFNRLRKRLFAGITIAFLVPLVLLSLYFHFQFDVTMKRTGKQHLRLLAESQRNTIDLFLQERVVNIFSLFHHRDFSLEPTQADMNAYLMRLREFSDTFVDAGFLNPEGIQIGYAGPHMYLLANDYSQEEWYRHLMASERNYYISDIYLGFRNKPHFTIAVKQPVSAGGVYVMRATLDPDKLYMFLRTIGEGKSVDSALINLEGRYQIVDPDIGDLLGQSGFDPKNIDNGVVEVNGRRTRLVATARLTEVPWILRVRQPLEIAYESMFRTRNIIIVATAVIIPLIVFGVWLTTSRLINWAERTEVSRRELKSQLYHAAKLVAIGELSAGVAHEINNPLAIILSQCGVIKDIFDPEYGGSSEMQPDTTDRVRAEIEIIEESVYRARDITGKLLKSSRRSEPRFEETNVNQLMDEVVDGFMEREFQISNIELIRDYEQNLPSIMADPDQLRQVLQNLINNASDAIEGAGQITLSTRSSDDNVKITVTDTGQGLSQEQLEKIFLPFFTTKEVGKGTGLGLSISLNIVESMGGRIDVQSLPGAGSSFIITMPADFRKQQSAPIAF